MKCKICYARFDTIQERDEHIRDEHPGPPQPVCPPSMLHIRDFLIEATLPDWIKNPPEDKVELARKTETLLREWGTPYVDNILIQLDKAGYRIEK